MERTFFFGKVDYCDRDRRDCQVEVEMNLEKNKDGKMTFSASACVWNHIHKDIYMGGQCLDDVLPLVERDTPYGAEFAEIVRLWKAYHLNDLHAGTPEQEKALRDVGLTAFAVDYEKCCDYLKEVGLYEVTLPDGSTYAFGRGWLTHEIPQKDLEEIKDIMERGLVAIKDYLPDKEQDILQDILEAYEEDDMER